MKYHIEKNTVQETLVIPLYGLFAVPAANFWLLCDA